MKPGRACALSTDNEEVWTARSRVHNLCYNWFSRQRALCRKRFRLWMRGARNDVNLEESRSACSSGHFIDLVASTAKLLEKTGRQFFNARCYTKYPTDDGTSYG